jgi:23S rRNA pseudouridine2605 synthase
VDLETDEVRVDGRKVERVAEKKVYFLLNKPRGVVCTQKDPDGRPRAVDLVPDVPQRVYCVGRLDKESTGILLLTNDGELTQHLTHPSGGVMKRYVVEVDGRPGSEEIQRIKEGVYLDGQKTQRSTVKVLKGGRQQSVLEIGLSEGRNREIRRILARLGHKVRRLKRVAIGPISDRGLKIGSFRRLTPAEVEKLWKFQDLPAGRTTDSRRKGPAKHRKSPSASGGRKSSTSGKSRSAKPSPRGGKTGKSSSAGTPARGGRKPPQKRTGGGGGNAGRTRQRPPARGGRGGSRGRS